jgi:hypothetical protein
MSKRKVNSVPALPASGYEFMDLFMGFISDSEIRLPRSAGFQGTQPPQDRREVSQWIAKWTELYDSWLASGG